jgi:WD40 repeat protein
VIRFFLSIVVAIAVSHSFENAVAQDSDETSSPGVSYYRAVRPILQRQCSGCHFPGKREGGLSVITIEDLLQGGDSGAAVTPSDVDASLLLDYVSGEDPEMPLNADPLSATDVALIRDWIAQGAADDTPDSVAAPISAENPPVYPSLPVVTSLDYSPDGMWLAVSGYHEVLLHRLDGSQQPVRLIGRSQRIESLCFSPDGSLLAVAGGTPSLFGELQIWSVADRKPLHSITAASDTLFGVSFNQDASLVAVGAADNRVRVFDVLSGELKMRMDAHSDWVLGTTFSLKNDHLISVSRDMSMKLTIVENGQFVDNITSITPGALKGGLVDVQRHPSREEVLAVGADGQPRLYRIFREQDRKIGDDFNLLRAYPKLSGRLSDLDFSTDGSKFVCGASTAISGSAQVCTTDDEKSVVTLQGISAPVFAVAYHPSAPQVAVAGFDGIVRIFDAASGDQLRSFPSVPEAATVAGSPGSSASGSSAVR